MVRRHLANEVLRVAGLTDDFEARLAHEANEALAKEERVLGDDEPHPRGRVLSGFCTAACASACRLRPDRRAAGQRRRTVGCSAPAPCPPARPSCRFGPASVAPTVDRPQGRHGTSARTIVPPRRRFEPRGSRRAPRSGRRARLGPTPRRSRPAPAVVAHLGPGQPVLPADDRPRCWPRRACRCWSGSPLSRSRRRLRRARAGARPEPRAERPTSACAPPAPRRRERAPAPRGPRGGSPGRSGAGSRSRPRGRRGPRGPAGRPATRPRRDPR